MNNNGRAVRETGIPLVEVIDLDRAEFERGLFTQGYTAERAAELAATIGSNDAALQMLARHRIASILAAPADAGRTGSAAREASRLLREDAEHLQRIAEDADEAGWLDWGAAMRQAAERILSTPMPTCEVDWKTVTVVDYNAVFDPADEAGRDAYTEGFREGWIFAQTPDGSDYDEVRESYGRDVDIEPQEAWHSYRDEWFKHLPLAALPPRP